jgi:hypothetical protein
MVNGTGRAYDNFVELILSLDEALHPAPGKFRGLLHQREGDTGTSPVR